MAGRIMFEFPSLLHCISEWRPVIEVRRVGPNTHEARTEGGEYSAVGLTSKAAVYLLRSELPRHERPIERIIPDPAPTDE